MNKRNEYKLMCPVLGKEIKYEILVIQTPSGGRDGGVLNFPQDKSCLELQCLYRDTSTCVLMLLNK